MSFVLREHWHCTFLAEDLRTPIAPARTISNPIHARRIRRGNGFRDLACRQADLAIQAGRGNFDLLLIPEQFAKLTGKL